MNNNRHIQNMWCVIRETTSVSEAEPELSIIMHTYCLFQHLSQIILDPRSRSRDILRIKSASSVPLNVTLKRGEHIGDTGFPVLF